MAINSRQKGKRIERWFKNKLKSIFPEIQRNANEQSARGGVDLINTGMFDFEVKGGKVAQIKKVRDWINQAESEGKAYNAKAVLVKPDREDPYVILPFKDFIEILDNMKASDII